MPRKFAVMPRASCSCRPLPRNTIGRSITAASPCSGAAAASFARLFATHQGSVRCRQKLRKLAAGPVFPRSAGKIASRLGGTAITTAVHLGIWTPAFMTAAFLLRWHSPDRSARELVSGSARLLRGAHLPARRQAGYVPHASGCNSAVHPKINLRMKLYLRIFVNCMGSTAKRPW